MYNALDGEREHRAAGVFASTTASGAGHMPTLTAVKKHIDKHHYASTQGEPRKS